MTEKPFSNKILIAYQQNAWYLALVFFLVTVIMRVLGLSVAILLTEIGLVTLVLLTIGKLVIIAENFRITGLRGYWLFCYLLVLILILLTGYKYVI